ncbi:hypothetical protein FXF51_06355 [Nonomuraea sp. PA05]|uniref:hypothetical protein n=1 Tax=Nonomuraea sp. PA05 TaxID=2604466 RepID=UPI0011DA8E0E|nr:hypothetical protein [Nonomuraea sp. PA05]TYB69783.1 hypothetical protein FXF51_06355 [Nonomuraea sp. PA05]
MVLAQPPDSSTPGSAGQSSPLPEIPEFRDIEQLDDGSWRAVHKLSGEVIEAATFSRLESIEAPAQRLAYTLRSGS